MADQGRMVKMWFRKAAQDLQTAKLLLAQNNEAFWAATVFHAQQSAEKSVKGYLTAQKVRFGKTHDMNILIDLVARINKELSKDLEPARILTKYAVAYRYPEESELPESLSQQVCQKMTGIADVMHQKLLSLCIL